MSNRPDEWKIEQGLHGASLPVFDCSGDEIRYVKPLEYKPFKDDAAIQAVGDRDELFREEREGWSGYVEWENYPEKKAKAHKILTSQNVSSFPSSHLAVAVHGMLTSGSSLRHQSFRWVPSPTPIQCSKAFAGKRGTPPSVAQWRDCPTFRGTL